MAINISVPYNGGLLPDIKLLTQGYYHRGTRAAIRHAACIRCVGTLSRCIRSPESDRIIARAT